jgi:hypothetical protein
VELALWLALINVENEAESNASLGREMLYITCRKYANHILAEVFSSERSYKRELKDTWKKIALISGVYTKNYG